MAEADRHHLTQSKSVVETGRTQQVAPVRVLWAVLTVIIRQTSRRQRNDARRRCVNLPIRARVHRTKHHDIDERHTGYRDKPEG